MRKGEIYAASLSFPVCQSRGILFFHSGKEIDLGVTLDPTGSGELEGGRERRERERELGKGERD